MPLKVCEESRQTVAAVDASQCESGSEAGFTPAPAGALRPLANDVSAGALGGTAPDWETGFAQRYVPHPVLVVGNESGVVLQNGEVVATAALLSGRDPGLVVSRPVAVFSGLGRLPVSGWHGSKVFK